MKLLHQIAKIAVLRQQELHTIVSTLRQELATANQLRLQFGRRAAMDTSLEKHAVQKCRRILRQSTFCKTCKADAMMQERITFLSSWSCPVTSRMFSSVRSNVGPPTDVHTSLSSRWTSPANLQIPKLHDKRCWVPFQGLQLARTRSNFSWPGPSCRNLSDRTLQLQGFCFYLPPWLHSS